MTMLSLSSFTIKFISIIDKSSLLVLLITQCTRKKLSSNTSYSVIPILASQLQNFLTYVRCLLPVLFVGAFFTPKVQRNTFLCLVLTTIPLVGPVPHLNISAGNYLYQSYVNSFTDDVIQST